MKKLYEREKGLILFRRDELVALAVNIDNLNLRIVLQMLTQFGDIHIHRAGIEVVVVNPDGLQGEVALQNLIGVRAKQSQQFVLLGSQLGLALTKRQQLLLGIEQEVADVVEG